MAALVGWLVCLCCTAQIETVDWPLGAGALLSKLLKASYDGKKKDRGMRSSQPGEKHAGWLPHHQGLIVSCGSTLSLWQCNCKCAVSQACLGCDLVYMQRPEHSAAVHRERDAVCSPVEDGAPTPLHQSLLNPPAAQNMHSTPLPPLPPAPSSSCSPTSAPHRLGCRRWPSSGR